MKYRRKPTVIEAVQFDEHGELPTGVQRLPGSGAAFVVTAHGQQAFLRHGDWIIAEPDGRGYYPCRADIFAETYEPVSEHDHLVQR